jgi:hypothetical protein
MVSQGWLAAVLTVLCVVGETRLPSELSNRATGHPTTARNNVRPSSAGLRERTPGSQSLVAVIAEDVDAVSRCIVVIGEGTVWAPVRA